jgi:hypothetical protein
MKAKYALAVMSVEALADVLQPLSASWDCSDIQTADVTTDLIEMPANFSGSCLKVLEAWYCWHLGLM